MPAACDRQARPADRETPTQSGHTANGNAQPLPRDMPALLQKSPGSGMPMENSWGQWSGMTRPDPVPYRTRSWKSYSEALKRRVSLLIWRDRDMARPEVRSQWPTGDVQRCGCPVLFDGDASVRAAVEADDRGWWRAFSRYLALTGRCRIFLA